MATSDLSRYRGASEAAVRLGHATYSGTVAAASRQEPGSLEAYSGASEAATRLGHATYSGTVAPAGRRA